MSKLTQGITHRYSEAFKLQVIEQIEQGRYTANQAAKLYGCVARRAFTAGRGSTVNIIY